MLAQDPRPYGVAKARASLTSASHISGGNRKAIVGRPLIISKAQNVLSAMRKVGCPHAVFSLASGRARQRRRARLKTGRLKGSIIECKYHSDGRQSSCGFLVRSLT